MLLASIRPLLSFCRDTASILTRACTPLPLAWWQGADMLKRILDECIFHHRGNEPDATEAAVDMLFALQDCLGASKRPC